MNGYELNKQINFAKHEANECIQRLRQKKIDSDRKPNNIMYVQIDITRK